MKNKKLFELLILNCREDITNFIMEQGKSPKPVVPFQKVEKEEENKKYGKEWIGANYFRN